MTETFYICKPTVMKHTGGQNCECGPDIFLDPHSDAYKAAQEVFVKTKWSPTLGNQTSGMVRNKISTLIS